MDVEFCEKCGTQLIHVITDEDTHGNAVGYAFCPSCRERMSVVAFRTIMAAAVVAIVSAMAAGSAMRELMPAASAVVSCVLSAVCFILVGVLAFQLARRR